MDNSSLKSKPLIIKPPKLRNSMYACFFVFLGIPFLFVLKFITESNPTSLAEKSVNCILFSLTLIFTVFIFAAMFDCIRNIFAFPTFRIDMENLFVCKYGSTKLSELQYTELKKNGRLLIFYFKDGSSAILKARLSNIPLETVVYAISIRQKSA